MLEVVGSAAATEASTEISQQATLAWEASALGGSNAPRRSGAAAGAERDGVPPADAAVA